MTSAPPFLICQVVDVDVRNDQVVVWTRSGQVPAFPVKRLHFGYADPYRVSQDPFPQIGTWGVVICPNCDIRNAIWLGSFFANLADASAGIDDDPHIEMLAHWSGFWRYLDKAGTTSYQWPDGTYLVVASGMGLPTVNRNIVNNQKQERKSYDFSDRVINPPSPFSVFLSMACGTTLAMDNVGNVTLTLPSTGTLTLNAVSGTIDMNATTINVNGSTAINMTSQTITASGSSTVNIDTPTTNISGNTVTGGDVQTAGIASLNSHKHTLTQPGTGESGPPDPAT